MRTALSGSETEDGVTALRSLTEADRHFYAAFERLEFAPGQFKHADHVRLAWIFLRVFPLHVALEKFSLALRRFAASIDQSDLYHQTITWAYLFLINERLEKTGREADWAHFAAANSDLFSWKKVGLNRYYSPERLDCDMARRTFLMPDRSSSASS